MPTVPVTKISICEHYSTKYPFPFRHYLSRFREMNYFVGYHDLPAKLCYPICSFSIQDSRSLLINSARLDLPFPFIKFRNKIIVINEFFNVLGRQCRRCWSRRYPSTSSLLGKSRFENRLRRSINLSSLFKSSGLGCSPSLTGLISDENLIS